MKDQVDHVDATPSKRLYLSIIADYDLYRSIFELVDNGLDVWTRGGRLKKISIKIMLDTGQQTITIEDNAGGLPKQELAYIVGPGQTGTNSEQETIGIFGVGTKRAVVALAQDIEIRTRFGKEETFQIDLNDRWLEDDDWELPVYHVDLIAEGSTIVELHKLRDKIGDEEIERLREQLGATYARFLVDSNVTIEVNGTKCKPQFFENWAYPPEYSPKKYHGVVRHGNSELKVEVIAGLTLESSPAIGEYGVYFYCNNRLVARGLKSLEVGFVKGIAGRPHPSVSLMRVLVFLNGDASIMPWNSSKSDISTKHPVFQEIQGWLMRVVKDFASLSRTWEGDWPNQVFKYKTGSIAEVQIADFVSEKKSYLPPLPRAKLRYVDIVTQKNKEVADMKPWTRGLFETIIAVDHVSKQRLNQKNRINLVLLDSTLEIAFKEYLVNEIEKYYTDSELNKLFKQRHLVHTEMKKYANISEDDWKKITHFNDLRNKLIHERASVTVSDADIDNFRSVVERVLEQLYDLRFDRD